MSSERKHSVADMLSVPPDIEVTQEVEDAIIIDDSSVAGSSSTNSSFSASASGNVATTRWQDIKLVDLVEKNKLIFINGDISVEEAFNTLVKHNLTSIPVEEYPHDLNCTTFDYEDLNTYLLLVLHKIHFDLTKIQFNPHFKLPLPAEQLLDNIVNQSSSSAPQPSTPVKFLSQLTSKNPFIKLNEQTTTLDKVVEILGSGVHRIAIVNKEQTRITGILSQRRLIRYMWHNARKFPGQWQKLIHTPLAQLNIGSTTNIISVFGDQPLIDALLLMHGDQISSVAVIDKHRNLLGNISIIDIKHVTKSSQSHLLQKSCLNFVSIILNSRGLENGQDSYPIFHVHPTTSLARTLAKLVATSSHRLWIVSNRKNSASAAPPSSAATSSSTSNSISSDDDAASISSGSSGNTLSPAVPSTPPSLSASSPASMNTPTPIAPSATNVAGSMDAGGGVGKLIGVVSLTDILGMLARQSLPDIDPHSARKMRRRSNSTSSRSGPSSAATR